MKEKLTIPVDLHTHSIHSDGDYSVADLLNKVKSNGGYHIALTDHDTCAGVKEARIIAKQLDLNLIAGVEVSTNWQQHVIHILGLNVDENNDLLQQHLAQLRHNRDLRARLIADKLSALGIENVWDGVTKQCVDPENISRNHFAHFLVLSKKVANKKEAFAKYLLKGGLAYVPLNCSSLSKTIKVIKGAGGIAVVAHPTRYKMSFSQLSVMISQFKHLGGEGIELVNNKDKQIINICKKYSLLASVGTDFHNDNYKTKVGINDMLPPTVTTIFNRLKILL